MSARLRRGAIALPLILLLALSVLGGAAVAAPHGSAAATGTEGGGPPPNIVVLLTDDQRWDSLWAMPNVQKLLVGHGVTFDNAFVTNALCCPSRTSILTGRYSHGTGVYRNYPPFDAAAFDPSSTLATWLTPEYTTGLFGKYLNGYGGTVVPPGWDRFFALNLGDDNIGYYDYSVNADGVEKTYGHTAKDYSTTVFGRKAEQFVRDTAGPLFLYWAPVAPHTPADLTPADAHAFKDLPRFRPPSYNEKDLTDKPLWVQERNPEPFSKGRRAKIDEMRRAQFSTLLEVDRQIGDLVEALHDTGRLSNTMIVFMSDNGFMHGEHRLTQKAAAYDESIRVPMVIRYPPLTKHGSSQSRMVLGIDLAPTFAELAGIPVGGPVDGTSLMPILEGSPPPWRSDFLIEHLEEGFIPTYCAVRSKTEKYVVYETGEEELYDLNADPYELHNEAALPGAAADLNDMRGRVAELCDPLPPDPDFALIPPA